MSRSESLPEAFVRVMGRVAEIDADVASDRADRHDYWRLRQLAEGHIADGLRRAADVAEIAYGMKQAHSEVPAK
jgi:hypothetical protein